jgi:putative oxidoreductase
MAVSTSDRYPVVVDLALLVCRIVLGTIFLAHGGQKLFGLWGGPGLAGMVEHMGAPLGYLVSIGEFFGGLGILLGVLSRFSAFWLIVIMVGAIVQVHGKNGFFLGGQKPGFEYNWALMGLAAVVLIAGPGSWALINVLKRRPNFIE